MSPEEQRFWSKVRVPDPMGCMVWTAGKTVRGYGAFYVRHRNLHAHTWIYQTLVGEIPDRKELHHSCENKACVNINHLKLVSHRENANQWFQKITHCPQGHPYDNANTWIYRNSRYCRQCRADRHHR